MDAIVNTLAAIGFVCVAGLIFFGVMFIRQIKRDGWNK